MHIDALEQLGGLDVLGSPKIDNQYHAGWAWAGSTPYKGVKLLASHLGGTRNPLAIRWPEKIAPDPTPRITFLHCNDVVPTIYDIVGITPPLIVNGVPQIPIAGVSFAYALQRPRRARAQEHAVLRDHGQPGDLPRRLDGLGVRSAGALAAGMPPGIKDWTPDNDRWELYHLDEDWSQANDLAAEMPEKLAQMRELFAIEAARNRCSRSVAACGCRSSIPSCESPRPIASGSSPATSPACPSSARPRWEPRTTSSLSKPTSPSDASGVLYALGGSGGGLTCYLDDGYLCYEYNCSSSSAPRSAPTSQLPPGPAHDRRRTATPN